MPAPRGAVDAISMAIKWALDCWPNFRAEVERVFPGADAETALRLLYANYTSETMERRADIEIPTKMRPLFRAAFDALKRLQAAAEDGRVEMWSVAELPMDKKVFEGAQIRTDPPGRMSLWRPRGEPITINKIVDCGKEAPPPRRKISRAELTEAIKQYRERRDSRSWSYTELARQLDVSVSRISITWVKSGYPPLPHGGSRRGGRQRE
jgi:hypothetical protein